MKQAVYQNVTDKIVADLEKGELTWLKPWSAGNMDGRVLKPLRHNGVAYNGINVLMLWAAAIEGGLLLPVLDDLPPSQRTRRTRPQGRARASRSFTRERISKTEEQDDGSEEERKIRFMKAYTVFNVDQIEGLPEHYYVKPEPVIDPALRDENADRFFAATGADVRHGGNQAYYAGGSDHVQMPVFECFRSPEAYYATLAHELTHWTKHKSRLDRDFGRKRFGDEGYAREELVAELGAAFLCADLGLTPEPGTDHAAYIQSWLKVLKNDKRAIFSAAAYAQKAADYLHSLQPKTESTNQEKQGVAA
jgi:antirestriction protein ArdC